MTRRPFFRLTAALGLAAWLAAGAAPAQAPPAADPRPDPDGVEVLTRGPLHEAYANPVDGKPQAPPAVPKAPPEPLEELPPDQKPAGENVQWIPGYWSWDDDRDDFIWISGFWRVPPPDRQWMPGHWNQTGNSWQWVPGYWAALNTPDVQFLPPPPEVVPEAPGAPAPAANSFYTPGCWVYRSTRYVWRPGYWVDYRPGWTWVPAHYVWTPAGYVFVEGYWDLDLNRRGLVFAPVYVPRPVYARPYWTYQPRFVIQTDFLFGALFVRPSCRHYYFGDYFDPGYSRRGYVAWCDFRIGRHGYDPLYGYYRGHHHRDDRWDRDLRGLYAARYSGEAARPPRTLVQQNTVVNNITINKTTNHFTNLRNVTAVTNLSQLNAREVRLQPVTRANRLEELKTAERYRDASRQRLNVEKQLAPRGGPPADAPRVAKVELPPVRTREYKDRPQPPPLPAPVVGKPIPEPAKKDRPRDTPRLGGPAVAPPRTEVKTPPPPMPKPEVKPPAPLPKPIVNPPKAEVKPPPPPLPKPEVKPPPPPTPKPIVNPPKPEVKPLLPRPEVKPPAPKPVPRSAPPPPKVESKPPPPKVEAKQPPRPLPPERPKDKEKKEKDK